MGKGDDTHDSVFEEPATLREPAAPRVPRTAPTAAVPVIPLSREEQARAPTARPRTLQEAREATDALLRDILEEEPEGTCELEPPPAPPPAEEDWPAELHPLPFHEG